MDTVAVRLFVLAADKLNISGAGRELGMAPAVASAKLAKLEKMLGADLLHAAHLIGAHHDARRRGKRGAAGVFIHLARFQHRLFTDNTGTAYFLAAPKRIGDLPVAVDQLDLLLSLVFDAHAVSPDIMVINR